MKANTTPEKIRPEQIEQEIRSLQSDIALIERDQRDAMRDFENMKAEAHREIKRLRDLLRGSD